MSKCTHCENDLLSNGKCINVQCASYKDWTTDSVNEAIDNMTDERFEKFWDEEILTPQRYIRMGVDTIHQLTLLRSLMALCYNIGRTEGAKMINSTVNKALAERNEAMKTNGA